MLPAIIDHLKDINIVWLIEFHHFRWGTSDYNFNDNFYAGRILDFSGVDETVCRPEDNIIPEKEISFSIPDEENKIQASRGESLILRLIINDKQFLSWNFVLTSFTRYYGKANFDCSDFLSFLIEDTKYPKTDLINPLDTSSATHSGTEDACIPEIYGNPYIPLRSLLAGNYRGYILGKDDGSTYTIEAVSYPTEWDVKSEFLSSKYDFVQSEHQGLKVFVPYIADGNTAGFFQSSGSLLDTPVKYKKSTTENIRNPIDILTSIFLNLGLTLSFIDSVSAEKTAEIFNQLKIALDVGLWYKEDTKTVISKILAACNSTINIYDKIYFKYLGDTVVAEVSKNDISNFSFSENILKNVNDAGIAQFYDKIQSGDPSEIYVPLEGDTYNNSSTDTYLVEYIKDSVLVQQIARVYFRKKYWHLGEISFDSKKRFLNLECGDKITINDDLYHKGDYYISSKKIQEDLSLSFSCDMYSEDIGQVLDYEPDPVTFVHDNTDRVFYSAVAFKMSKFVNIANCQIYGNNITKVQGDSTWISAGAYSTDGFLNSGKLTFKASQVVSTLAAGISKTPQGSLLHTEIDFYWMINANGTCQPFSKGVSFGPLIPYTEDDVFCITYDGYTVNYYLNDDLTHSTSTTYNQRFYFLCTFFDLGGINSVVFSKIEDLTESKLQTGIVTGGYIGDKDKGDNPNIGIDFYNREITIGGDGSIAVAGSLDIVTGGDLNLSSGSDLNLNSGSDVNVNSGGKISIDAGGELEVKSGGVATIDTGGSLDVKSGGDVSVDSGGTISLESGSDLNVKSGSKINVKSGGDVDIESGADLNVNAGGKINVANTGDIDVNSGGKVNVKGGKIDLTSAGAIDLNTGTNLNINAGGKINVASTGVIDVNSGADLNVNSGADLNVKANGVMTLESNSALNVASGGKIAVASGGDIDVDSGANVNVNAGGLITAASGGGFLLDSGGEFNISDGGSFKINTGGGFEVNSGGSIALNTGGNFVVNANGKIILNEDAQMVVDDGGYLEIDGGGLIAVEEDGDLNILYGGNLNINSGGNLKVNSGGGITLNSNGNFNVNSGGEIILNNNGLLKLNSGSGIDVNTGGALNVKSGNVNLTGTGAISLAGTSSMSLSTGTNLNINAGGKINIANTGGIDINTGGTLSLKGGKIDVTSAGVVDLASGTSLNIKGGKIDVTSSGAIDLATGTNLNVKAGGKINVANTGGIDINTGGALNLKGGKIDLTSSGLIDVNSGTNINLKGGKINLTSSGSIELATGTNLNINAGGKINVASTGGIDINSGAALNIKGGKIDLTSSGLIDVNSGTNINLKGGKINLTSSGAIDLATGTNLNINAGGKINVASTGNIDVNTGGALNVKSGNLNLTGKGAINLATGTNLNINAGGKINIANTGGMDINTGGSLNIKGGNLNIESGGHFKVKSGGDFVVDSGGKIELNAADGLEVNSGAGILVKAGGGLTFVSEDSSNLSKIVFKREEGDTEPFLISAVKGEGLLIGSNVDGEGTVNIGVMNPRVDKFLAYAKKSIFLQVGTGDLSQSYAHLQKTRFSLGVTIDSYNRSSIKFFDSVSFGCQLSLTSTGLMNLHSGSGIVLAPDWSDSPSNNFTYFYQGTWVATTARDSYLEKAGCFFFFLGTNNHLYARVRKTDGSFANYRLNN